MTFDSIKSRNLAIDLLREYAGRNPYLLKLKRDVILNGKVALLSEFNIEYIHKNVNTAPKAIKKTVRIADWYGEKLKDTYSIEFIPEKVHIIALLGETNTSFHCYIKYRQNMDPLEIFLPKKGVLENFLVSDYHTVDVDFNRYDNLSMSKDPNRRLKEHQKDAVRFLISRKKCILADDMGLGKTLELSVAAIEGNFDSVVIICPASLKTNWKRELEWYVPERDISIIDSFIGKTKGELEKFLGYAEGKSGLSVEDLKKEAAEQGNWKENRFIIINYDILDKFYEIPKSRSQENISKALENSPLLRYILNKKSLLIIDEAHRLSNNTSIRYKVIKDLIKRGNPDSIYLSTGTPITNSPQNLFCLLQLIENDISSDWQYYMDRYCGAMKIPAKGEKEKWTNRFLHFKKKPNWYALSEDEKAELKTYIRNNARMITVTKDATNLDELKTRISHIYLRRIKEDLNEGLPEKHIHEILYDFDLMQTMEYERLWEEYEKAQLEADPTKEINKELLEGAIYRRYCSNQMVPNTIKLAEEFIAKGEKVVIATCYDDELNILKEHFGDKCVVYNGKMSAKQKDAAQEAFTNDPNIMVFLGQIIAAGVGITLIASHIIIFNDLDYVPGNVRQFEDRIYRIGQTKDVHIYYQIFRNTQYEKIWNLVLKKELNINQVIKKEDEK